MCNTRSLDLCLSLHVKQVFKWVATCWASTSRPVYSFEEKQGGKAQHFKTSRTMESNVLACIRLNVHKNVGTVIIVLVCGLCKKHVAKRCLNELWNSKSKLEVCFLERSLITSRGYFEAIKRDLNNCERTTYLSQELEVYPFLFDQNTYLQWHYTPSKRLNSPNGIWGRKCQRWLQII